MRPSGVLVPLLGIAPVAHSSIVRTHGPADQAASSPNIPLLIWHGLGDAFDGDGIKSVGDAYNEIYPGSYVYAVRLAPDTDGDRKATWLGEVNVQIDDVCNAIAQDPVLKHGTQVNALGFSQGGQFIRGLLQRCEHVDVRNLVTFGSQHAGIAAYRGCTDGDWFCNWVNGLARSNTWGDWVQRNLVPAQYYRDPNDLQGYLDHSNFLADINNEREFKKPEYKQRLAALDMFAMYVFTEDEAVHPKESSWFAEANMTSGDVTWLQDTRLYKEDWLGLKKLDRQGKLVFKEAKGQHMQISDKVLTEAFVDYFKPASKSWLGSWGLDVDSL